MGDQSSLVNELTDSPVFLLLFILILLSSVIVFILPLLVKIKGGADTRKLNIVKSLLDIRARKILSHKVQVIAGMFIIVLLIGAGYWFYLQGKPQMVTAGQLNNKEEVSLSYIQNNIDHQIIENSDMYVLDVRTEDEYVKEHIKGSFSVPIEKVKEGFSLPKDKKIVVYSSKDNFKEAREAAEIFKKQVKARVYVVKGGFESLKEAGVETQAGRPFGD